MVRLLFVFLVSVTLLLTSGCPEEPAQTAPVALQLAAAKLTILVIDDPGMAGGMKLLRGEWAERTGGELEIEEGTIDQLLSSGELSADLVVYPSRFVGVLVAADRLRPVRKSTFQSGDLAIEDYYPLIRNVVQRFGSDVYALSLGEPPLMLAIPSAGAIHATWENINQSLSIQNSPLKQPRVAELLARGVAYSQSRNQAARLFSVETMEPQIASPPFVKALQQMLNNEKLAAQQSNSRWGLSWPNASRKAALESFAFVSLPLAGQVYNPSREVWETNETDEPLALLGFAGRSVSVTRWTRNSASAFKLLKWLLSESIATQLSSRSNATLWFRKSQTSQANKWLAKDGASEQVSATVSKLLSSSHYFMLPRIPGIDEYLQTLEETINRAISFDLPAETAGAEVVVKWNALTDRYGRDRQRVAYRKHLGLDDSSE